MALPQKLSLTDLNNGDSVRLLLEQLLKQIDSQQNENIELRGENDRLLYDNHELEKRVTKVEMNSSYMCLTFVSHKNQVQIKKYNSYGRRQPIDNKKDVDIYMGIDISVTTDNKKYTDVIQNAADSDDVQYRKSFSFG